MTEQDPILPKAQMNDKELAMLKIKKLVFRARAWAKRQSLMVKVEDKRDEPMESKDTPALTPEAAFPLNLSSSEVLPSAEADPLLYTPEATAHVNQMELSARRPLSGKGEAQVSDPINAKNSDANIKKDNTFEHLAPRKLTKQEISRLTADEAGKYIQQIMLENLRNPANHGKTR